MLSKIVLLTLLNISSLLAENNIISDKDYGSIPLLFELDNYDKCMLLQEKALFCTFTFILQPTDSAKENRVWNIIKNISVDPKNYRHDQLRHGICVPSMCSNFINGSRETSKTIELCYNKKYYNLGLRGNVSEMVCHTTENEYPIDTYDIVVIIFFGVYLLLIIFASIYEGVARTKEKHIYEQITDSKAGKLIASFSIPKNWYRLTSPNNTPDAKKLRSIQGIRFYNMICVILCHTIMISFAGPVANPKYIENVTGDVLNMFLINGQYAVQTFFIISGLLLSFHFFQMLEEKKNISLGDLVLAFVNRYIRLTPTLMVILAFESTWIIHMGKGPQWNTIVGEEYRNCRNNWWTNILYINNYVHNKNMCLHQTWYLAADTQLFILSLLLLKIASMIRRQRVLIFFGAAVAGGLFILGCNAFIGNYDIVVRQYSESLYKLNSLQIDAWHVLYSSGHSNIVGYMIGLTAGYLFFTYRNIEVPVKKIHIILWWILTFGLCIFIILIAGLTYRPNYKYTKLESALYWAFGKNLFGLGIAIGIFGFTQKIGGFARWFCEWKVIQVFGRLTYSTYIIHVSLIRMRAGLLRHPLFINDYLILTTTLGDIVLSYLGGTILCLVIEMPISALQKLLISRPRPKAEVSSIKFLKNVDYNNCNNGIDVQDKVCTKV